MMNPSVGLCFTHNLTKIAMATAIAIAIYYVISYNITIDINIQMNINTDIDINITVFIVLMVPVRLLLFFFAHTGTIKQLSGSKWYFGCLWYHTGTIPFGGGHGDGQGAHQ